MLSGMGSRLCRYMLPRSIRGYLLGYPHSYKAYPVEKAKKRREEGEKRMTDGSCSTMSGSRYGIAWFCYSVVVAAVVGRMSTARSVLGEVQIGVAVLGKFSSDTTVWTWEIHTHPFVPRGKQGTLCTE